MKKINLILGLLLAAAALYSCRVSELDVPIPAPARIFHAVLEPTASESETRAYANSDYKLFWNEGDKLSIFYDNTYNREYEFIGLDGATAGDFKTVGDLPASYTEQAIGTNYDYAILPYDSIYNMCDTDGNLTVFIKEKQEYYKDMLGIGARPLMIARSKDTDNGNLIFKHVGSYVGVRLKGDGVRVASISIRGNNSEPIAGRLKFSFDENGMPVGGFDQQFLSTASRTITMTLTNPVVLNEDDYEVFWFNLPEITFEKGLLITITDDKGATFEINKTDKLTFKRTFFYKTSATVEIESESVNYAKTSSLTVGGTYLIVDASDTRLFTGATNGSYVQIKPENDIITDTDGSLSGYRFTVENSGNNYYLRFNDGKYLVCDYGTNGSSGIVYVNAQSDVRYPFTLTTGGNGAFFFSTTKVNAENDKDQVLYYKAPPGTNSDIFKIGETGRTIGVHLFLKDGVPEPVKQDRGLSFNPENVTCTLGETPQNPVLSGNLTAATVTYSSSNNKIATVDANGIVTLVAAGIVTITASTEEDSEYKAGSASYTLKVKWASTSGTYVRVTRLDQINLDGEYIIAYENGAEQKAFKPILNAAKNAFSTSDNAVDITIIDDEMNAEEADPCRFTLANQDGTNKKFSLQVPEADGTTAYYLIVYGKESNSSTGSSTVFYASPTSKEYRSTFSLSSDGKLTLQGNSSYKFRYSSGSFSASNSGSSDNLYLFVRSNGSAKQKQTLSFDEPTVSWMLGEDCEIGQSKNWQEVHGAQTTVTYSSDSDNVAKIEGGQIKIVGTGSATITATAEKTDKYYGATASYTLRILKAPSQEWVDLGTINLENEVLCDYLNQANAQYTDTNDDTYTVMPNYVGGNYSDVKRKDIPNPVTIRWTYSAASKSTVICIYEDKDLTKQVWTQDAKEGATSADVYNLIPGPTYYYTVSEGTTVWERGYFKTTGRRRMMKVSDTVGKARANNCRDLGGLEVTKANGEKTTIRYGLLFRGSCLDATTEDEKSFLVGFMNVGLDVDLRGDEHSSYQGNNGYSSRYQAFGDNYEVEYNSQIFASGETIEDLTTPAKVKNVLTDIFKTIKSGKSVYFHCHIGADRTGYMAMLIEGLLGVSEKDCSIDYELTSFSSAAGERFRNGEPVSYTFRKGIKYLRDLPGDTFQNKIENYLVNTVGIPQSEINDFKSAMLQ